MFSILFLLFLLLLLLVSLLSSFVAVVLLLLDLEDRRNRLPLDVNLFRLDGDSFDRRFIFADFRSGGERIFSFRFDWRRKQGRLL